MKCAKSRYDLVVISLNLLTLCMSGTAAFLLGYPIAHQVEELPQAAKLHTVYASLFTCMVINVGLIIAIIITPPSALSFNMWLRPLLSTVGAGFQITCAALLFESYLSAPSSSATNPDYDSDMDKVLASAIILLVNSLFYVADVAFIVCFYTYHVFKDYGDY